MRKHRRPFHAQWRLRQGSLLCLLILRTRVLRHRQHQHQRRDLHIMRAVGLLSPTLGRLSPPATTLQCPHSSIARPPLSRTPSLGIRPIRRAQVHLQFNKPTFVLFLFSSRPLPALQRMFTRRASWSSQTQVTFRFIRSLVSMLSLYCRVSATVLAL